MFQRCLLGLCLLTVTSSVTFADTPSLLKIFGRTAKAKPIADANSFKLSAEDGPWLILAATFVGNDAKQRAQKLATEIRSEMRLPAYIYNEKFDFTGKLNSPDRNAPKMRYANQYEYEAYAVLVGEYDSVENKNLEKDLASIRTASPSVFDKKNQEVADPDKPVTMLSAIKDKLTRAKKGKGPMASAFVTRNPLLPKEYFDAPEVDSFVHALNKDFPSNNLLQNKGKFTVIVRTFQGLETVVDGRNDKKFLPNLRRLDQFAEDAEKMTAKLRADGVEAYQFHDRFKSIVTIGSFDELGRELPDGRFEYSPEIRRVMKKYSALNDQVARVIPQQGIAANHIDKIPFDVKPTPIAVPKPSKRSLYSSAFGRR